MRLYFLFLGILFASCNNQSTQTNTDKDTTSSSQTVHANATPVSSYSTPILIEAGCYQQIYKKDTADLRIEMKDSVINGYLRYNHYQKDGNIGSFKGVMRDSLLLVTYTFRSEGMTSEREIIFKAQNNQLYEAICERDERTGKQIYVNKSQLQYNQLPPFVKVDCSKINEVK